MKVKSVGITIDISGNSTWDLFNDVQQQVNEFMSLGAPSTIEYVDIDLGAGEFHLGLRSDG